MEKKFKYQSKGITLIALIVTIVVLLILAGVSIAVLTGENGILNRATEAKTTSKIAEIEEQANLILLNSKVDKYLGNSTATIEEIATGLRKKGYSIEDATLNDGEITGITLNNNGRVSIAKGATTNIIVNYLGTSGNTLSNYYAVVDGKRYLIQLNEGKVIVSKNPTEIDSSAATTQLTAVSDNENVSINGINGNTITLQGGNTTGEEATITVTYGEHSATCIASIIVVPSNTQIQNANTENTFSTKYGKVDVIWLENNTNVVSNIPNTPILTSNNESMTPVSWTYSNGVWTEDSQTQSVWYNYIEGDNSTDSRNSKWANAKTKNGSYFVWIPRYAFRITYYDVDQPSEITSSTEPTGYYDGYGMWDAETGNVKYANGSEIKIVESGGNKYIVHPAFLSNANIGGGFGNLSGTSDGINGIWFAKYEMSGATATDVKSLPSVKSQTNQEFGDVYVAARGATYGFIGTDASITSNGTQYTYTSYMNSHIIKNSEWGAALFLMHSQYGRNGNQMSGNQCEDYYTGYGRGLNSTEDSTKTGTSTIYNQPYSLNEAVNVQKYNGNIGVLSSTTGNVYGIYDMAGGVYDAVAGFNKDFDANGEGNWRQTITKMTRESMDGQGNYISTKYVTIYDNPSKSSYDIEASYIGEAVKEVKYGEIYSAPIPWFNSGYLSGYTEGGIKSRGGKASAGYGGTINVNAFSINGHSGDAYDWWGYRTCLCPE